MTEDRRQKPDDRRQKSDDRDQMTEIRWQKSEDRNQTTEDRRPQYHLPELRGKQTIPGEYFLDSTGGAEIKRHMTDVS